MGRSTRLFLSGACALALSATSALGECLADPDQPEQGFQVVDDGERVLYAAVSSAEWTVVLDPLADQNSAVITMFDGSFGESIRTMSAVGVGVVTVERARFDEIDASLAENGALTFVSGGNASELYGPEDVEPLTTVEDVELGALRGEARLFALRPESEPAQSYRSDGLNVVGVIDLRLSDGCVYLRNSLLVLSDAPAREALEQRLADLLATVAITR